MNDTSPKPYVVSINTDRCQGHTRCCTLAPELFESDDLGYGCVRGDGTVSDQLLEMAKLAAANCPEGAIMLRRAQS
ncbi:MAG: hypothetical protein RL594_201 [Bacteroidota bacterium]|jgi:ferredoxin